jgi:hypothetical protein
MQSTQKHKRKAGFFVDGPSIPCRTNHSSVIQHDADMPTMPTTRQLARGIEEIALSLEVAADERKWDPTRIAIYAIRKRRRALIDPRKSSYVSSNMASSR